MERGGAAEAERILKKQAKRPSHPAEALPECGKHPLISLQSVRHALNAAEPVTPDALDAFEQVAVPLGFHRNAMQPSFGMAEHTVYVADAGGLRARVSQASLQASVRAEVLAFGPRDSHGLFLGWRATAAGGVERFGAIDVVESAIIHTSEPDD